MIVQLHRWPLADDDYTRWDGPYTTHCTFEEALAQLLPEGEALVLWDRDVDQTQIPSCDVKYVDCTSALWDNMPNSLGEVQYTDGSRFRLIDGPLRWVRMTVGGLDTDECKRLYNIPLTKEQ